MKLRNKIVLAVSGVVGSSSAFATGNPTGDAITAAVSAGQGNYSLVVIGVIGLAAIGFGLGMIVQSMRS